MSHFNPGLISAYNSLTDKHLTGYFNNTRIRRHLQRVGLITRSGRIVPDKEYRHRLLQRAHQRHIRECLAQAIFHKVLEMERLHQIDIKRKLEEFARRERVHKIKVERSRRYEEDVIHILSPRPPTGPRGVRTQHSGPEGEHTESSESPGSSRPNTAPGKMQRPVRLKPIHSNSTTASHRRRSPHRRRESSNETNKAFNTTMDKEARRRLTITEFSRGISPYCLPVINNFVTPVPPPTKKKDRGSKVIPNGTLRGRRLRPTTAPSGPDINEDSPMLRTSVHQSGVCVNMVFFGKTVHLSHDLIDMRDEVKVFQQHCGGENLCVYKGKLREGETFQFVSRRHRGFPFSLTFFLNGLQVERLSSCCEFKHRKGSRLGGRHGHFGVCGVEGASPCYKCIIAMGLDKKPTPPPKRVREDAGREVTTSSPSEALKDAADADVETETETEKTVMYASPRPEPGTNQAQNMETEVNKDIPPEEDKPRDEYEEDFEADDEGPAEDGEAKDKISPSPSSDKERQDKEREASDSEDDDKDEDRRSRSASSSSGSDRESEVDGTKDVQEDQTAERSKDPEEDACEVDREETPLSPTGRDEPAAEDSGAAESGSPTRPRTTTSPETQDSAGWTEVEVSETSAPSGNEARGDDDSSGAKLGKETEETEMEEVEEVTQEEESERAKSVQEKLAEAILKEAQCSSEPELSDTSTEEEEESTDKLQQQDNKDTVPEKAVTLTLQQQTQSEEKTCEERADGAGEVAEDQGEAMPGQKEQVDETEPEPLENINRAADKVDEKDEEVEKDASEVVKKEDTQENDKPEEREQADASPHPESEGKMADDTVAVPEADEPTKSTDAESTEEDQEKEQEEEEMTVEAVDTQPNETEQGASSSKEDESPAEELKVDNAEAEAVTSSETAEIKVEPSEEPEALGCKETPGTDTEKQGDEEATVGGSNAEVTADDSSSSSEGSGETTVEAEKTADTSEIKTEDEPLNTDDKEEAIEEASQVDASKGEDGREESVEDNQMNDEGGEETEKPAEINSEEDMVEKEIKREEDNAGDKETIQDEITEGVNVEDKEHTGKDETEEEEIDKSKAEEKMEGGQGNTTEGTEDDGSAEGKEKEELLEGTFDKRDEVTDDEKVGEAETSEKDDEDGKIEDSECVEIEAEGNKSEEEGTTTDKTAEGEESSQATEEQAEKTSNENIVLSEDVGDLEAVDEANGAKTEDKADETRDDVIESERVQRENEEGSNDGEKGEVDAENGEMETATEAQQNTEEDEAAAVTRDRTDTDGEENTNDENTEAQTEEHVETETPEGTEDHEERADECQDDKVDQAPNTDKEERESKTEGDADVDADVQHESREDGSAVEVKEAANTEDKPDDVNTENTKQQPDKNGEGSDIKNEDKDENEDKDSDMNTKNDYVQTNVKEVIVVSSGYQTQFPEPTTVDLNSTAQKLDEEKEESIAPSDSKIDEVLNTDDENAADVDPSAVDGENGADTEEASKPSEEGASVVMKPQAESPQHTHNDADHATKSSALAKEAFDPNESIETDKHVVTPEALEREDNRDLVTNWVTLHQASKFFEKFAEPLDDLKGLTSDDTATVSNYNTREIEPTNETELARSGSRTKTLNMSEHKADEDINVEEDKEVEPIPNDVNESGNDTKVESIQSDLRSNRSKDDDPCESEPTKDTLQVMEETKVTDLTPITETGHDGEESSTWPAKQDTNSENHKGTSGSLEEDKDPDAPTQRDIEDTNISKTEIESIVGTLQSVASVRPESVTENQTEEEATKDDQEFNEKQIIVEEIKDLLSLSKTKERQEPSVSPERLSKLSPADLPAGECEDTKETRDKREEENTDITDLTTFKSEDGCEGDSQSGYIQSKPSDGSISGDNKDVQLIEDVKHTHSKDQLSSFSVEETSMFGRSSYPLFTTARTESGY